MDAQPGAVEPPEYGQRYPCTMANTLFTRFLAALGVPHTATYSDAQFRSMTFKSLFGLSYLLKSYGIENEAVRVADKSELVKIQPPFLAQTAKGVFVIVTGIDPSRGIVTYDSLGESEHTSVEHFESAWNGVALLAFPDRSSAEPDYRSHRITGLVSRSSGYILAAAFAAVFAYFFVTRHIYAHASLIVVAALNLFGLWLSYMLLQKSVGIHTRTSEHVCGVLERGGCDSIMELKVSKLFGVFSWSEVGFGYFGVSLVALLAFPDLWGQLALFNVCCLPYTLWSIWYQRFRAHHWCTLCVGVQATLWLIFAAYLAGGWLMHAFPLGWNTAALAGVYVGTVLLLNRTVRNFNNTNYHETN